MLREPIGWIRSFFASNEIPDSFRMRVKDQLEMMSAIWWSEVTEVLDRYSKAAIEHETNKRMAELEKTHTDNRRNVIREAFSDLVSVWRTSAAHSLDLTIGPDWSAGSTISCKLTKEMFAAAGKEMKVWKCPSTETEGYSSELEELGAFGLAQDEAVKHVFSVQTRSVLVVSCVGDTTKVYRVEFPRGKSWSTPCPTTMRYRTLNRCKASVCDYNAKERILLVGNANSSANLFRLDERLTSMEVMRTVDLTTRTSLSLPIESGVVCDGQLHMVDQDGAVQSLNIRNLQASREHSTESSLSQSVKRGGPFCVGGADCIGWIESSESEEENTDSVNRLRFFATEDMRELPQSHSTAQALCFRGEVTCQVVDDRLFVADVASFHIHVVQLKATLKSDSYRIQSSGRSTWSQRKEAGALGNTVSTMEDHWGWCLYHLYEKFPVCGEIDRSAQSHSGSSLALTFICESEKPKNTSSLEIGCSTLLEAITKRLRQLNKPLYGMDLASSVKSIIFADECSRIRLAAASATFQAVSILLRELITFVPIQICRAEFNSLTLLCDGQLKPHNSTSGEVGATHSLDASDIARTLRFGLLSPLLQSWSRKCIVISSMGKQSTGKSYFLNHLTGSSFAIAGARCTDGAWMSVRTLASGVLLVVIDFEGLGSFERTEQEDVFLSVLNASVSMLTIFRMEMRLDKEIDDLFSKFQKGSQLIKSDPQLFRGKLYMSVKDVNPNDQCGVLDEFGAKFQRMVEVNKEQNFLTDMYAGQLEINCSPPLGSVGYYRSLAHVERTVSNKLCVDQKAGFPTGKAFLDCIRLLLAKISILDWTSMDETLQKFKVAELAGKLPNALRFGCHVMDDSLPDQSIVREDLVASDTGKTISVSVEEVFLANKSFACRWRTLCDLVPLDLLADEAFDFGKTGSALDAASVEATSTALRSAFVHFVNLVDTEGNGWIVVKRPLQLDFDAFLGFVVRRRCLRVQKWCRSALGDRIPDIWFGVEEQAFGALQARLVRCLDSCSKCHLGCLKATAHVAVGDQAHDCGTNHACLDVCSYCQESNAVGKTPTCGKAAGHEGRCECARGDHTCRQPCVLAVASNCAKFCTKKAGHTEGEHRCAAGLHKCGQPCCARGCTRECVVDVEVPHQVHKCAVDRCISPCVMDGCNRGCSSQDHFHGFTEAQVTLAMENQDRDEKQQAFDESSEKPTIHMCDEMHTCPELCAQEGICHIDVFLKQSSKTFIGARGSFQYTFQEMNGSRKKCRFKLPVGQTTHAEEHSCCADKSEEAGSTYSAAVRHYCDMRCPCCSYFCQKEHGHAGSHKTTHGNMRNTTFLSDALEIDLIDRKYTAGERGTAEMCNLYCSKMGRSHVHFLDCERPANAGCAYNGSAEDMRRHCTRLLEPKPDREQDEVLHERFWDTLGWEDPCTSVQEREEFGKCAYKCDAPDHDGKEASYCVLSAWHVPAVKQSTENDGFTYVGGHQFQCSHISASNKMHHVFVLDASGSMAGSAWQKLLAAFGEYVQNRITMGATGDLVSVVTFESSASIVWEAQDIVSMARANVPFTSGGTSYGAGLRAANEVLSRVAFDAYKPVIIFFSDGHPGDAPQGEQLARHISHTYAMYGLEAFAVGFGSVNLSVLHRVADRLGGSYCNVLTGDELKTTFHSISASLGTRAGLALTKPAHEMICVICQKELAREATAMLTPCQHELHQRCLRRLLDARATGETALCPTCRQAINVQG